MTNVIHAGSVVTRGRQVGVTVLRDVLPEGVLLNAALTLTEGYRHRCPARVEPLAPSWRRRLAGSTPR